MNRFVKASSLVVLGLSLCLGAARAQLTGQVYEITMAGSVVLEEEIAPGEDALVKDSFTTSRIINLARGRDPESAVPANEKLSLVFVFTDDTPLVAIIVYNTTTQSNLATVAQLGEVRGAFDPAKGKGYINLAGGIFPNGGLTGGWLAITGKATIDEANTAVTILSLKASAVQGSIEGNDGEGDFEALITKGKLAVVGYIGTLVLDPN